MEKDQTLRVEDAQRLLFRKTVDSEDGGMNLCRRPSLLDLPGHRRRLGHSRSPSRSSSRASDGIGFDAVVLHWDSMDIDSWLEEIDMTDYKHLFKQQEITTGRRLLSLQEEHLKEIGVIKVGHRLELSFHIDELRKAAGWVSRAAFVDISTLLNQSVFIITCKYIFTFCLFSLDIAKMQKTLKLYPKRIILIRHGEV